MLVEGIEEIGVDEGKKDEANAFDFDNDVFVFLHPNNIAFVSLELSTHNSYGLAFFEFFFCKYLTSGAVVGCEQAQQLNGGFGNYLYLIVFGISIYPKGY